MAMFSKPASGFTVSYYHTDRLGSVRAMTDASGTLVGDRHDYAPFGEDTASITGNPMRFGGKELDAETALHYFEARYYRQTWGRFTQVDPASGWQSDPQSWNRYAYARNNPLKYVDPTGLSYTLCVRGFACQDLDVFWIEMRAMDVLDGYNYFRGDHLSGEIVGSEVVGTYRYYCGAVCEFGERPDRPSGPGGPNPPPPDDGGGGGHPCQVSPSACLPAPIPLPPPPGGPGEPKVGGPKTGGSDDGDGGDDGDSPFTSPHYSRS